MRRGKFVYFYLFILINCYSSLLLFWYSFCFKTEFFCFFCFPVSESRVNFYSIILDSHPSFLIHDGSYPAFLKWLFDLTPNRSFFLSLPFPNVVFQLSLIVGMDAASLEENHPWTRCCCAFSFVFYLSPLPILTQKVFFNLFFFFIRENTSIQYTHFITHG